MCAVYHSAESFHDTLLATGDTFLHIPWNAKHLSLFVENNQLA